MSRKGSGFMALAAVTLTVVPFCAGEAVAAGYRYQRIATLGDSAPGGGTFEGDFEPYAINKDGLVSFVADLSAGGEGVFFGRSGSLSQVARTGQVMPGGGTLSGLDLGRSPLNDSGDIGFQYVLEPVSAPIGFNAGVYGYDRTHNRISAVALPGTPAPGGGSFQGTWFDSSLNNSGKLAFAGLITGGDIAPGPPGVDGMGVGYGVFLADRTGAITSIVRPGDPAPGGGVFDFAIHPSVNAAGDVAFGGHVDGEDCYSGAPQEAVIQCFESVYLKRANSGQIVSIAHQDDPAPGGGTYRLAFGPVVSNKHEVVFIGDLTPPPGFGDQLGVFLYSGGATSPVARPGDAMPGGGHMVRASFSPNNFYVNNNGDVVFAALLDTDDNGDGEPDTGVYVQSGGVLQLLARTGTVLPGLGTVAHMNNPFFVGSGQPSPGTFINDDGRVLTQAILTDGRVILLVAIPRV